MIIDLDTVATFTYSFGNTFLLETRHGNFVWSDPEYLGGDNTIKPFDGSYKEWCDLEGIPYGRCKGEHTIRSYCGENVKFVEDRSY